MKLPIWVALLTGLLLVFDIWQQSRKDPYKRKESADLKNIGNAGLVCEISQNRRAQTTHSKCQPEKQSGDQSYFAGDKFGSIHQNSRERGGKDQTDQHR